MNRSLGPEAWESAQPERLRQCAEYNSAIQQVANLAAAAGEFALARVQGSWYIELVLGALRKAKDSEVPSPGPFGRFYLQELINSGGMADIWLATDSHSKAYALRRIHR